MVGRTRHKMVLAEVGGGRPRRARLIELRLDFLAKAPDFKRLRDKPCPLVATVPPPDRRRPMEGQRGRRPPHPVARPSSPASTGSISKPTSPIPSAAFAPVRRIVSYHNLHETPADLEKIHAMMREQDADVVKVAVTANTPADVRAC